jgi:hypothetical protein
MLTWTIIGESLAGGRPGRGRERRERGREEKKGERETDSGRLADGFVSFRQISNIVSQNILQFWLLQQFVT